MKNKILIPMMLFMMVALVGMVSAVTVISPSAGSYITGNQTFNITHTDVLNATHCNITGTSSTTGSSFLAVVGAPANVSKDSSNQGNQSNVTLRNSFNLTDCADMIVTVKCSNNAGTTESTTVTLGIDNSRPVCEQSTFTSDTTYNIQRKSKTLTVTGTNATSATAVFGSTTFTLDESSDTFTKNVGTLGTNTYQPVITTSDGRNETNCTAVVDVNIRQEQKNPSIEISGTTAQAITGAKDLKKPIIILCMLAAGALVFFIAFKKD